MHSHNHSDNDNAIDNILIPLYLTGRYSHQFELTDAKLDVKVTSVLKVTEHYLKVVWDDGHTGLVPRTDRGNFGPESVTQLLVKYWDASMRYNKVQKLWTAPNEEMTKIFDWGTVVGSVESTREYLLHFLLHGIGILSNIPFEDKSCQDLIEKDLKIGPLIPNMYEIVDTVILKPDNPNNNGYQSIPLPLHFDLQYYSQAMQVQFLGCSCNEVEGGESFFVDAMAVVVEMREEQPEYFQILTQVEY